MKAVFYCLSWRRHTIVSTVRFWIYRPRLIQCGRELPKGTDAKKTVLGDSLGSWLPQHLRERGREEEREGQKYQYVIASRASPTGNLVCNPGMCPDWELNRRLTFWFTGQLAVHWATPARATVSFLNNEYLLTSGNCKLIRGWPSRMWFVEAYVARSVNFLALLVFNFATFSVVLIWHLGIVYKALLVLVTSL